MTTIFERNLSAFDDMGLSDVTDKLRNLGGLAVQVVGSTGAGDLNIDLGSTLLYADNAEEFARGQVQQYLSKPNRFFVNPPAIDSPYVGLERQLYTNITNSFPTDVIEPKSWDAGYLISFGLGLGLHIPKLLKSVDVRDVIIVEQFWEFICLSLQTIDWRPICENIKSKGGALHFVVGAEPGQLSNKVYKVLRGKQFGLLDGSYGIQHYASPLLTQTHNLFREMLSTLGMSAGFFVDECLMVENVLSNLGNDSVKNFKADEQLLKDIPVFVVGSGPSVDTAILALKKNQDNALIISAGTGLGVLLRAGVKPHMHCEIENVPDIYDAVVRVGSKADIKDIVLMASNTVEDRLLGLFETKMTYFRDSLTSSNLFAEDDEVLYLSGPTVSNLACRTAIALGVKDIYLFGIDLGTTDPNIHHAKDSAYFRGNDEYWQTGAGLATMDQEIKGNFRDVVYTNGPFLLTRTYFNELISAFPSVTFRNCSDGAYLEGAIPTLPFQLDISKDSRNISVLISDFCKNLDRPFSDKNRLKNILLEYEVSINNWYSKIGKILSSDWRDGEFENLYDQLIPLLNKSGELNKYQLASITCNAGTVMMMVQFGYAQIRRIDENKKPAFMRQFCKELNDVIAIMKNDVNCLLLDHITTS